MGRTKVTARRPRPIQPIEVGQDGALILVFGYYVTCLLISFEQTPCHRASLSIFSLFRYHKKWKLQVKTPMTTNLISVDHLPSVAKSRPIPAPWALFVLRLANCPFQDPANTPQATLALI